MIVVGYAGAFFLFGVCLLANGVGIDPPAKGFGPAYRLYVLG